MSDTRIAVSVMDTDVMQNALALIIDVREAICSAMSEGWDTFSEETQQELSTVLDRIDELPNE